VLDVSCFSRHIHCNQQCLRRRLGSSSLAQGRQCPAEILEARRATPAAIRARAQGDGRSSLAARAGVGAGHLCLGAECSARYRWAAGGAAAGLARLRPRALPARIQRASAGVLRGPRGLPTVKKLLLQR
nr:hypothetical protein [Tanacetum cinerariifolium]